MKSLLAFAFFFALVVSEWTVIHNNFETIALANSFVNSTNGWVAGGTASLQPLFLYTQDGGNTFDNHGLSDTKDGAFLSIRVADNWGVAGGFGFFGLPCGAYSNDGSTWSTMEERGFSLVCAFQGSAIVNDGKTGVLIGSWSHSRDWDGNGIEITTDGGNRWSQINGDFASVPARYGSFVSKDLGYVTAGIWADEKSAFIYDEVHNTISKIRLNRRVSFDVPSRKYELNLARKQHNEFTLVGYAAYLSAVTNEGNDWTLKVNITNDGIYFNEIDCIDSNNCWAVAEGVDKSGNDTASIFHTSDGWNTYDVQLTVPGGSLIAVDMLSTTYGWVGGALLEGDFSGDFEGIFYYTTDGINWTLDSTIKNFYPMDISVTDNSHAFASGITPVGLSSFASYSS